MCYTKGRGVELHDCNYKTLRQFCGVEQVHQKHGLGGGALAPPTFSESSLCLLELISSLSDQATLKVVLTPL